MTIRNTMQVDYVVSPASLTICTFIVVAMVDSFTRQQELGNSHKASWFGNIMFKVLGLCSTVFKILRVGCSAKPCNRLFVQSSRGIPAMLPSEVYCLDARGVQALPSSLLRWVRASGSVTILGRLDVHGSFVPCAS